jgi:hypothetical protein
MMNTMLGFFSCAEVGDETDPKTMINPTRTSATFAVHFMFHLLRNDLFENCAAGIFQSVCSRGDLAISICSLPLREKMTES